MDFSKYLPETLKTQYDESGQARTVLEKVLELFAQVLSGEVSTTYDFQSKVQELQYFWDAYEVEDLTKLKAVLDPENIVEKIANINEICGSSTPEESEKAFLMTVPLFSKMKGTLKGLTNVLHLFGITISILPWYDSDFPLDDAEECSIMITASVDSGCLVEESYDLIREIVELLLDVCSIIARFDLVRKFRTQLPIQEDILLQELAPSYCLFYDWRRARECCDLFAIASVTPVAFYTSPTVCPGPFQHDAMYSHSCFDTYDCALDRIDLCITDPIIRACAEIEVKDITYIGSGVVRYTFDYDVNFGFVVAGDPVEIRLSTYSENDGAFYITAVNNMYKYIEITNALRTDATKDETSSPAIMAINLSNNVNSYIIGYGDPVRGPIYSTPFIPKGSTSYGCGELLGDLWIKAGDFRECPDIFFGTYSIQNADFQWQLYENDSIGDEYYLQSSTGGDPGLLSDPNVLIVEDVEYTRGTVGDLRLGEWDYDIDSSMGFNTIFIKLADGTDPSLKADHTIEAGSRLDYCVDTVVTHASETRWAGPIPPLSN